MLNSMFIIQEDFNGQTNWIKDTDPANSVNINGEWTLVKLNFMVQNENSKITFLVKGDDYKQNKIIIDDLLVRESKTKVYKVLSDKNDSVLLFNNHRIRMD